MRSRGSGRRPKGASNRLLVNLTPPGWNVLSCFSQANSGFGSRALRCLLSRHCQRVPHPNCWRGVQASHSTCTCWHRSPRCQHVHVLVMISISIEAYAPDAHALARQEAGSKERDRKRENYGDAVPVTDTRSRLLALKYQSCKMHHYVAIMATDDFGDTSPSALQSNQSDLFLA